MKDSISRGDIWLIKLDPTFGSEIKKTRPCIVISPSEMNECLRTVMVAPMTTKAKLAPFRVSITHAGKKGLILLDQLRTIDKARLVKKIGVTHSKTLNLSLEVLQQMFSE